MDEAGLIRDAQNNDLDAFNRLVLAYQDMAYTQAYRVLGEQAGAEDAVQEAFLSAFRNMRNFRGGSFRAWLLRIVTNACYDELRRRQRRPTTPLEPLDEDDEELDSAPWMADPGESPEERLQRRELAVALQHCLDRLPDDFRLVVVLVDIQGLDYQEASTAMRKPVGTIKSRLARGRSRMRDCLKGAWELLPTRFRLVEEGIR